MSRYEVVYKKRAAIEAENLEEVYEHLQIEPDDLITWDAYEGFSPRNIVAGQKYKNPKYEEHTFMGLVLNGDLVMVIIDGPGSGGICKYDGKDAFSREYWAGFYPVDSI